MSTPHPPPRSGETPAATGGPQPPGIAPDRGPHRPRRRRWGPLSAVAAGVVIIGGTAVAVARSGEDEQGTSGTPPASSGPRSSATITSIPPTTTTIAPGTSAPPATSPPAVQPTSPRPSTSVRPTPVPPDALELGSGVYLPLPSGWATVSGPDDPLTISDGRSWYSAQVMRRSAGEGPQPVVQAVVDALDADNAAVSSSPVRFQGTISGAVPADDYSLVYSAIGNDGGRLSGTIHALVRGDGLVLVVDAWNATDAWPGGSAVPPEITAALQQSLTAAPKLGAAETLPVVAPFRITSSHAMVSPHGLAGFTVPPGFEPWQPVTVGGISFAGATNGSTDLVAIAMPAPESVEDVFAAATADLDERYPGLVIDPPAAQGTRDGASRLGAGFAGTLGGRPIAGGLDAWLVDGDTAYAFAYTYYADIEADGANPDPVATQFAYSAFADSF